MIEKIDKASHGTADYGWLWPTYHFSFAGYYNPEKMGYGKLRVLNDDTIAPHRGFDTHPHEDMEIVTYIIAGKLTHADSMGHERELSRGEVQYMSAGTGVFHSEHNKGDEPLRLLQIWVLPDKKGHEPNYGEKRFAFDERVDRWLHIVSAYGGEGAIQVHQDVNFYATAFNDKKHQRFEVGENRQAYLVQIEGKSIINGVLMEAKDAMHIVEENLEIEHEENSHMLVIEMAV